MHFNAEIDHYCRRATCVTVRFVSVSDTPHISFSYRKFRTRRFCPLVLPPHRQVAVCPVTAVNSVLDVFIKAVKGVVCRYRV